MISISKQVWIIWLLNGQMNQQMQSKNFIEGKDPSERNIELPSIHRKCVDKSGRENLHQIVQVKKFRTRIACITENFLRQSPYMTARRLTSHFIVFHLIVKITPRKELVIKRRRKIATGELTIDEKSSCITTIFQQVKFFTRNCQISFYFRCGDNRMFKRFSTRMVTKLMWRLGRESELPLFTWHVIVYQSLVKTPDMRSRLFHVGGFVKCAQWRSAEMISKFQLRTWLFQDEKLFRSIITITGDIFTENLDWWSQNGILVQEQAFLDFLNS